MITVGYLHIPNLYKDQRIQEFNRVYCLEKIHGTSAHISWKDQQLSFFSGGEKHERFVALFFKEEDLEAKFKEFIGYEDAVVYGEAYGGKQQGMSATYGPDLKFVVFDIKINGLWLALPQAVLLTEQLGLEFVAWAEVDSSTDSLNAERDKMSVQAERNGMGSDKRREGIVIRPPFEVALNNGERLITKHKNDEFKETKTPRVVGEKLEVLKEAEAVADEWTTPMRLDHVLDKLPLASEMKHTSLVIKAMVEDVLREAEGEIVVTKAVKKAIANRAAKLWKARVTAVK